MSIVTCDFCDKKQRVDVYVRHCFTHSSQIIVEMPTNRMDYIKSNKLPYIYTKDSKGKLQLILCLVCKKGQSCKSSKSDINRFMTDHKLTCGAKYDTVSSIFGVTYTVPDTVPTQPVLDLKECATNTAVRDAAATAVRDTTIRDALVTSFPEQFDDYWQENQEEDPETVLQMIDTVKRAFEYRTKRLNKLQGDNQGVIDSNKKQVEKRCADEMAVMDTYRISETVRANRNADNLELAQMDVRTGNRLIGKQSQYISTIQQLLRNAGIEYDPFE